jgi:hypothetical protein
VELGEDLVGLLELELIQDIESSLPEEGCSDPLPWSLLLGVTRSESCGVLQEQKGEAVVRLA